MEERTLRRYKMSGIVLHWTFASVVTILVITGMVMFVPGKGPGGGYATGIVHRIAAAAFLVTPIAYSLLAPKTAASFLKETLSWGRDDLKWLIAAPDFYFGGSGKNMPQQGRLNTGQKMWQLILLGTGLVLLVTGMTMGFFRSAIAVSTYQWILFAHGTAFVVLLLMLLVHSYMAVHPQMRESIYSMLDGKVSPLYARDHHRKWYNRIMAKMNAYDGRQQAEQTETDEAKDSGEV